MDTTPSWIRGRGPDRALLVAFLLALAAPWIDTCVRDDEARSPREPELRVPAEKPALAWDARALWRYPAQYEAYFQDSFGLRDKLLRWHSLQTIALFHTSPSPLVFFGKDDWMFYSGDSSIPIYRGLRPFTPPNLQRFVEGLRARADWLRAMGCQHLLVIAPNKESVYPDQMPAEYAVMGPTRLEQLLQALEQRHDVHCLDLRKSFAAERARDPQGVPLYYPEGTHWSGRGTLIAYQAIAQELAQMLEGVQPMPEESFDTVTLAGHGETWRRSMYIADTSTQTDKVYSVPPAQRRARVIQDTGWGRGRTRVSRVNDPNLPRVLVLHDSFGPYVEEALSEHASEMTAIWSYDFPAEALTKARPQVMIEIWVERALGFLPIEELAPKVGISADNGYAGAALKFWRLSGTSDPAEYLAQPGLRIERQATPLGEVLDLVLENLAGSMLLPEIPPGPHQDLFLELEIDSSVDTTADLFFLRPGDSDYSRKNNVQMILNRGSNRICVRLPEADAVGRLRLRPGFVAEKTYRLRSAELRGN